MKKHTKKVFSIAKTMNVEWSYNFIEHQTAFFFIRNIVFWLLKKQFCIKKICVHDRCLPGVCMILENGKYAGL